MTPQPPRGVRGDIKQLHASSSAAAAELRKFLREMRGKSPQEMLGAVAQSDLVRSTLTAAGAMIVLLLVLTVVPFVWAKVNPKPVAAPPASAAPAPAEMPAAQTDAQPTPAATPNPQDIADTLGIGEQKPADPKVNPLENKADDLLKGLE